MSWEIWGARNDLIFKNNFNRELALTSLRAKASSLVNYSAWIQKLVVIQHLESIFFVSFFFLNVVVKTLPWLV
jgi:hypothetical protein